VTRVGLNECEAPVKVVTAGPPKRLVQLRSVSHVLFKTETYCQVRKLCLYQTNRLRRPYFVACVTPKNILVRHDTYFSDFSLESSDFL